MTKAARSEADLRRRFVLTLTTCASVYGAIWAYRLIGFQADSVTDILKFSSLIFITTLIASYIWWRLIRHKFKTLFSGGLAGGLTALTIIPLPTFFGGFKTQIVQGVDLSTALVQAAQYSLSTFSLAEFIAIPMSMAVGMWAARQP